MAEIRPFRALRYTPEAGSMAELVCPPYDIISESQRLAYLKRIILSGWNCPGMGRIRMPKRGRPSALGWKKAFSDRMIRRLFMCMRLCSAWKA